MNTKLSRVLSCCFAAYILGQVGAHATTLGFSLDPAGDAWNRGDANTGFMFYDRFPSMTFANASGTVQGINNPVMSQTLNDVTGAGAGLYNSFTNTPAPGNVDGDIYFGGGAPILLTLSGDVNFTIRGLVFQIKRPGNPGGLNSGTVIVAPKLIINGGIELQADASTVTSSAVSGDSTSPSGAYSVTSYYWNASLADLVQGGANSFALKLDQGAIQRGLDGMALDVASVAVVPEPTSGALLACGAGVAILLRRRRLA